MSEQYEEQNLDSSGQDQTEGGAGGGEGGGEENNEADMIFAPEASKPGRNAGMLMVAFVLIGVGVIYFMRTRTGPNSAVAANPDAIKAETSIKEFIRDGNQIKKMKNLLDDTQKMVDQYSKDRTIAQNETKLDGNPFEFKSPTGPKQGPKGDPHLPHDKAQAQFLEGINNLRVQYLMVSAFAKTAMINNKLVQEGQEIDGYAVEKITPSEVFFSKTINGFTFKAGVKTGKELK